MRRLPVVRILIVLCSAVVAAQTQTTVRPIKAPEQPFPTEQETAGITRFSFIAYGDTRCDCAGGATQRGAPPPPPRLEDQNEHGRGVDLAVAEAGAPARSPDPVRLVR